MEFEDQLPASSPGEAAAVPSRDYNNIEQASTAYDVNNKAISCNPHSDSDISDSDPETDPLTSDTYDSGNDADISVSSDSDNNVEIEACTDSDVCDAVMNSSDDEANVLDARYAYARGYQHNNLIEEDDFSLDSEDSNLSDELADQLDNNDPFCGFVDQSVVVESVKTVDFYESMNSFKRRRRDPDTY